MSEANATYTETLGCQENHRGSHLTRREVLKVTAGAAGSLLTTDLARAAKTGMSQRPNVLYIHSHDTGRYTSPYGYKVPTPNLQRLANEGILFRNAFCAAPTCSASRASLLTGECSHSNGMLGLVNRGFAMTPEGYSHHIIRTLKKEAGYYSALIGLQHIASDPHIIGYDYLQSPITKQGIFGANHVEEVTPAAVKYIKTELRARQPFWLTVGYFETHRPYPEAGPDDELRYISPPSPIPDAPVTRRDMADFYASVRKVDWGVGQVLAALEEAGLAENTLVISTTDHGIAWPDMKCSLYDGGLGVHLIMRGPGRFQGGKECNALVSHLDIFPTLCDFLDIRPPDWLQGRSFLPVLRDDVDEIHDAVFSELNFHASYEPKRAVRTKRWKFIRRYDQRIHPVLPNCDDGGNEKFWAQYGGLGHLASQPDQQRQAALASLYRSKDCGAKTYWLHNEWAQQTVAREGLYDLMFDPNERNNLATSSAHRAVLLELRDKLENWMRATHDPLLKGLLIPPRGAILNDPNEVSPLGRLEIVQ